MSEAGLNTHPRQQFKGEQKVTQNVKTSVIAQRLIIYRSCAKSESKVKYVYMTQVDD